MYIALAENSFLECCVAIHTLKRRGYACSRHITRIQFSNYAISSADHYTTTTGVRRRCGRLRVRNRALKHINV